MTLLRIDSSARASSVTRQLTSAFVDAWRERHPQGDIVDRDLARTTLPPITDHWAATYRDESGLTADERQYLTMSDTLVAELRAADVIVIGSPMYNLSISADLKGWIDHIVRLGKTVAPDRRADRGLLHGRRVVVVTSRGGSYQSGSPRAALDFQEPYLREILRAIGLADVTFVHAEHQANPALADQSRAAARDRLREIVNEWTEEVVTHGTADAR
jgi:FMN-dependent NADH-azoreductase